MIRSRIRTRISPLAQLNRAVRHAWLTFLERHYTICADTEAEAAVQARENFTYYQNRATLARAARDAAPVQ